MFELYKQNGRVLCVISERDLILLDMVLSTALKTIKPDNEAMKAGLERMHEVVKQVQE